MRFDGIIENGKTIESRAGCRISLIIISFNFFTECNNMFMMSIKMNDNVHSLAKRGRDQHAAISHRFNLLIIFCMIINFIIVRRVCIQLMCAHCSRQLSFIIKQHIYTQRDRVNTLAHTHKYTNMLVYSCVVKPNVPIVFFAVGFFSMLLVKRMREIKKVLENKWH